MAEVVVVHGHAGSGKTTHCQQVAAEGLAETTIQYISVGNLLRAIRANTVDSRFAAYITAPSAPSPLPYEIVNGAIFESIEKIDYNNLLLIDGYPRHPEAVDLFHESLDAHHLRLAGTLVLDISLATSTKRVLMRGVRSGEKMKGENLESHASFRYNRDIKITSHAIAALGRIAPIEYIDANETETIVHSRFTAALGRLAMQDTSD